MNHNFTKLFAIASMVMLSVVSKAAGPGNGVAPYTIDSQDTVFYDLSMASVVGTVVSFPVYIKSDDQVFALDFAFKYNQLNFEYDTILNLSSYIDPLSYYNPADSTVRLTSYSLSQPYPNDTILVMVRFNIISGTFCSGDIYDITSQLNGDACTSRVIECQPSGISDILSSSSIALYPNPVSDYLTITKAPEGTKMELMDLKASSVLKAVDQINTNEETLNISTLTNGVYLVRFTNKKSVLCRRLVVSH
ncbi:MAG TPA: T9SS type A sorting domain-containing protein [Bacteroidia bacterium]|nr:T9SS type A sorting domain-containing protein [Bacteroidia bacterium]